MGHHLLPGPGVSAGEGWEHMESIIFPHLPPGPSVSSAGAADPGELCKALQRFQVSQRRAGQQAPTLMSQQK